MFDPTAPPPVAQRPGLPPMLAGLANILAGGGDVAGAGAEDMPSAAPSAPTVKAPDAPTATPPFVPPTSATAETSDAPPKSLQDAANMSAQAQSSPTPPPDILAASKAPEPTSSEVPESLRSVIAPPPSRVPTLAPPQHTFADKLRAVLPIIGMVGAGLEAGGNRGEAPNAARLQATLQNQRATALQQERLRQVEEPETQAHIRLQDAQANSATATVPITVNGVTYPVRRADLAKVLGAQIGENKGENVQKLRNEGSEKTTQMKISGAEQIAQLKAGAPMHIDPEWAKLAGQPQLANQDISGATLANFVKVLGSKGIAIKDFGNEGLWAADKAGNRIKQVTTSSPSVARAEAFASARAANTPVDIFDPESGQLRAISQAQQLRTGAPSAARQVSTGKAAEAVYQPALDADMRLKQMYQQATDVSGASDQALLFNHIAMTGGAVKGLRMGEYLTEAHRTARGIPESLGVLWNKLASGESLSPQQRMNFVHLGENVRQAQWDKARRTAPLVGAANEPAPDTDLPELSPIASTGQVPLNSQSPPQQPARVIPKGQGLSRSQGNGNNGQPAPEGTVVHMPDGSTQVKRGGKWVRQ